MGRQSNFTPAEDRIIVRLRGEPAEVVNAALTKAGYSPQTPERIAKRRYYLSRVRHSDGLLDNARRPSLIAKLELRRTNLNSEIARLDQRRAILIAELDEVVSELRSEVAAATGGTLDDDA